MKTLVLIRHAHRDTSKGRDLDNGLSQKGKKQRSKLSSLLLKRFKFNKIVLFSSPSKRCIQTLKEIARKTNSKISILHELGEKHSDEYSAEFKKRIRGALKSCLANKSAVIFLCSHGDFLPIAAKLLCGKQVLFAKGACIEFEI